MKPVVIHVCRDIEYVGGVEIFLSAFLLYNREFDHKLVCTAGKSGGPRANELSKTGIEVNYFLGNVRQRRHQLQSFVDSLPDPILHCHLFKPELIGHKINGCRARIATKYCTYASDSQVGTGISGAARRAMDNKLIDPWIAQAFDDVIVISGELEKKWKKFCKRTHRVPISHITNFSPIPRSRVLLDKPTILCAARMVKEKRHDLLIDALSLIEYEKVFILGGGPMRGTIEQRIQDHCLPNVHVVGVVSHDRVIEYMDASDVLLLTSKTEGLPLLIQEAMSRGLVVVATDVGGNHEMIDKMTGVLVSEETPQAIANSVQGLSGCDIGLMGRNAIEKCRDAYSLEITSKAISAIYRKYFFEFFE